MFISRNHLSRIDMTVEALDGLVDQTRSYSIASVNEINKKINALTEFLGVQFEEDQFSRVTVVKKSEPFKKAAVKAPSSKSVPSKSHPVSKPTKKAK